MKPWTPHLVVLTATANLEAAKPFIESWQQTAAFEWPLIVVENGGKTEGAPEGRLVLMERADDFLGSVPAFTRGLTLMNHLKMQPLVIAAFHDDLTIYGEAWDATILAAFQSKRSLGLAGFSGATGLGDDDIYQTPYRPQQLARKDFVSNLRDAEMHGRRGESVEKVVCCDGFSLIGRASWWLAGVTRMGTMKARPWHFMRDAGVIHHAYDSALGALAARAGYETEFLPVPCHHAGGRTAVANQEYGKWAAPQGGDGAFWEHAHQWAYAELRDQLPLRVR